MHTTTYARAYLQVLYYTNLFGFGIPTYNRLYAKILNCLRVKHGQFGVIVGLLKLTLNTCYQP